MSVQVLEQKSNIWQMNEFAGYNIRMRKSDGYFNGSNLCKINPKKSMKDYLRNKQTISFVEALNKDICKNKVGANSPPPLIDIIQIGDNENRGTWIEFFLY